jgi:replicative DNA helicase
MKTVPRKNPSIERLIDHEGERLILGNILSRGAEFWKPVGPQLEPECFAVESHRRVFVLMKSVADRGGVPDIGGCFRAVIDHGKTTEELGLPQLSDLAYNDQIDLVSPAQWVQSLKQCAAKRRLWREVDGLRAGIETGMVGVEEISKAREELRRLEAAFDAPVDAGSTIGDAVNSIGIEALLSAPRGMIGSPWERLNDFTNGGPRPGEFWLVASRPSVGKTTAALQWAITAAAAGKRVLFASLEMPQQDLLKRAIAAEGNIPHGLLVRGDADKSWRFRIAQTLERIGAYPLEITDKVRSLSALVAKIAATPGLALVVVDYLGLIEPDGRYENRNQEVSAISRRIKLAALDYGIPIIAAHQLNRANESENRRPQLSDLRDSGSLEQDADTVLLLDAPATRKRAENERKDALEMLIAKQRNGVRGYAVKLRIDGAHCRIVQENALDQQAEEVA